MQYEGCVQLPTQPCGHLIYTQLPLKDALILPVLKMARIPMSSCIVHRVMDVHDVFIQDVLELPAGLLPSGKALPCELLHTAELFPNVWDSLCWCLQGSTSSYHYYHLCTDMAITSRSSRACFYQSTLSKLFIHMSMNNRCKRTSMQAAAR